MRYSRHIVLLGAFVVCACLAAAPVFAAPIAGADFSDSAVFNAAGGSFDNGSTDDINPLDGITVSGWSFAGGGGFQGFDGNAQNGMPNDNVTKFNGDGNSQPSLGTDPTGLGLAEHIFSITIPGDATYDLTDVTFDWRKATGGGNVRWLAFKTSLDDELIFSELGQSRNAFDSESIVFSDPKYMGLTDTTVDFQFYAGGQGSGDIDIDTIVVSAVQAQAVPEPASIAIWSILGLALAGYGYRRRRRNS